MDAVGLTMKNRSHLLTSTEGTSAIEFAIVGPVFLVMAIGMIYCGLVLFSMASLQYAVEAAARCGAMASTGCTSSSTIQTYAASVYYSPVVSPTFTASTASCGTSVSATAHVTFNWVLHSTSVPLSASACFP